MLVMHQNLVQHDSGKSTAMANVKVAIRGINNGEKLYLKDTFENAQ